MTFIHRIVVFLAPHLKEAIMTAEAVAQPVVNVSEAAAKFVAKEAEAAAPAGSSLDSLAQEVQTRLANHATYHAQWQAARASHDASLAAMKSNATALQTAQTALAAAVTADTATVTSAVQEAASAS